MKCSTCQNYINTPIECNLCKEKFCSEKCIFSHNQLYHQPGIDQSQDLSVNNNSFLNYARETPNSESPFLVKGVMNYSYIIYEPIFAPENFTLFISNGVPKSIGSGSFGNVYLAINNINKKMYAIKHMEKDKLFKYLTCLDPIYAEIDIQSRINHPNIVKLLFVRETQINFDLVMDYAQYGTLFDFVVKNKGLPEKIAFKFFIQVVNAIKFLHDNDVIHRDIKPENILLFENDVAKLCDFGCSIKCTDRLPGGSFRGTTEYMAPELINDMDYGKEIDMWMLGILLYELMHGFSPFRPKKQKFEEKEVVENIMNHNISFYMPVSDDCKELIYSLLEADLHKRCTIDEVYNSKFVKNFEKEEFEASSFDKEESENIDKSNSNNGLNISNQQDNFSIMQIMKSQIENRYNDNEDGEPNIMIPKEKNENDISDINDMSDIGFVPVKTKQNCQASNLKRVQNDNLPKKKLSSNQILNNKKELFDYSLIEEDQYENEPNAPKNNRRNRNRNKQNVHNSIAKLNLKKHDNILSPIRKKEEGSPKNTITNSPKNNVKNKKKNNNLELNLNPNTILNNNLYTSRRYYRQKESLEVSNDKKVIKKEALKTGNDRTEKRPKKEIANYIFNNNKEIDKKQKLSKKTSLNSNNQMLSLSLSPGTGNYLPLLTRSISPHKQFVFQKDKSDLINKNDQFHFPLDVNENKANISQNLKDFPFDHLSSNSSLDIRKPVFITKIQKTVINKEKVQEKIVTKEKEPNDNMRRKNKKEKKETPQDNYNKNNINKNIKPNNNSKKGGSFVNNINSNIISKNSDTKIDEYLVNINTNNSVSLTNEIQKIKDNINTIIKNTSFRNFSVRTDDIRMKRKNSDDSIKNPFNDNNKTQNKDKDKDKNINPFSSDNLTTILTPISKKEINDPEGHLSLKNTSLKNNSFVGKNKRNQLLSGANNMDSNTIRKQKLVYTDKREKKGKSVNKQMKDFREFKFNKSSKQKKEMKLVKVNKNISNEIKEDIENNKENENEIANINIKKIENIENNQIKEIEENENKEIKENENNKIKNIENIETKEDENKEVKIDDNKDSKNNENKEIKENKSFEIKNVENKEKIDVEIKEKADNENNENKEKENKEMKNDDKEIKENENEKKGIKNGENKESEMTENKDNENKESKNVEGEKNVINKEISKNNEVDEVKIEEAKEIKIIENKEKENSENKENEVIQKEDFNEKKEEKEITEKNENINTEKEKENLEEKKEIKIEEEVMNNKKEEEEPKMNNENNEKENKEKKIEIKNNINESKEKDISKDKETEEYTKTCPVLDEENSANKRALKEEINNNKDLIENAVSNEKNSPILNSKNTENKSDKKENENKSNRQTIPKNNKIKKNEVKNNNGGIKKKDVKVSKKLVINKNNNKNNESSQKATSKQNIENNKNEEKKEVKKIVKKNVVIKTLEIEKADNNKEPKDKLKIIVKTQQRKYSKEKRYTKVKIDPKSDKALGQSVKISTNPNLKNRLQNKVTQKKSQVIEQLTNSSIQEYTIQMNNDETRNNNSSSKKINGSNSETKNTSYSKSHISNIKDKIKSFSIMGPEDINKMNKSRSPYYRKPFQFKNKLERKEFLFQEEDYDFTEIKQIKLVKKNIENKNIRDRIKNNTDKYLNQLKDKIENESLNNIMSDIIENENNKINEKNENKENIEINKNVIKDRSIESNKERRPILNIKNKSGILKQKKKYRKVKSDEVKDENEQNEKFNNDSESLIIDGDSEYGDSEIL